MSNEAFLLTHILPINSKYNKKDRLLYSGEDDQSYYILLSPRAFQLDRKSTSHLSFAGLISVAFSEN